MRRNSAGRARRPSPRCGFMISSTPTGVRSAGGSLETRKLLLGHKNGDITTHYSAAQTGELIAATNRICSAKGTPRITLLRVADEGNVDESRAGVAQKSTKPVGRTG